MDGLMHIRTAVTAEASALLALTRIDAGRDTAEIALASLDSASDEALRRAIEALVMAAGGAERGPRGDALNRLLQRIITHDPALGRGVTLGSAKIHVRAGAFLVVSQAPVRRGNPALQQSDWTRATRLLEPPRLGVLAV
jgi:hypothetical protein